MASVDERERTVCVAASDVSDILRARRGGQRDRDPIVQPRRPGPGSANDVLAVPLSGLRDTIDEWAQRPSCDGSNMVCSQVQVVLGVPLKS